MFCYFYKEIDEEVLRMQTDEIVGRARLLDNEIKVRFFMSTLVRLSVTITMSLHCNVG